MFTVTDFTASVQQSYRVEQAEREFARRLLVDPDRLQAAGWTSRLRDVVRRLLRRRPRIAAARVSAPAGPAATRIPTPRAHALTH